MSGHAFVDESKRRDYLLAAAVVVQGDIGAARFAIRELLLPGQRRLHMSDERDNRRRQIASTISRLADSGSLRTTIYDAGRRHRNERERRRACIDALVKDLASTGVRMVVFERDDTLLSFDRQRLIESSRAHGCQDTLRFRHYRAAGEPLLAIPDAIAWCYAKGGDRRIGAAVGQIRQV